MTTTETTRHLYHYPDMTDLAALRREAQEKAAAGERVVLHLHEYKDEFDGCAVIFWPDADLREDNHELFEEEDA